MKDPLQPTPEVKIEASVNSVVELLARRRVTPMAVTIASLPFGVGAAVAFGFGLDVVAGILLLSAGALDMLDGRLARRTRATSKAGAVLDSTLDRIVDSAVLAGLLVHFHGAQDPRLLEGACVVALFASFMISYQRSIGENLAHHRPGGFWQRPERIVLLSLGGLAQNLSLTVLILAAGTTLTAGGRFFSVWSAARAQDRNVAETVSAAPVRPAPWQRRGSPAWIVLCLAIGLTVMVWRPDLG